MGLILHGAGPGVMYKAARQTQRMLWISDMAKTRHPALHNIVTEVCNTRGGGSRWSLIKGGKDDFLDKFKQQKARTRAAVVLGVVASKEDKDGHRH